jgi:hypothetical protein
MSGGFLFRLTFCAFFCGGHCRGFILERNVDSYFAFRNDKIFPSVLAWHLPVSRVYLVPPKTAQLGPRGGGGH